MSEDSHRRKSIFSNLVQTPISLKKMPGEFQSPQTKQSGEERQGPGAGGQAGRSQPQRQQQQGTGQGRERVAWGWTGRDRTLLPPPSWSLAKGRCHPTRLPLQGTLGSRGADAGAAGWAAGRRARRGLSPCNQGSESGPHSSGRAGRGGHLSQGDAHQAHPARPLPWTCPSRGHRQRHWPSRRGGYSSATQETPTPHKQGLPPRQWKHQGSGPRETQEGLLHDHLSKSPRATKTGLLFGNENDGIDSFPGWVGQTPSGCLRVHSSSEPLLRPWPHAPSNNRMSSDGRYTCCPLATRKRRPDAPKLSLHRPASPSGLVGRGSGRPSAWARLHSTRGHAADTDTQTPHHTQPHTATQAPPSHTHSHSTTVHGKISFQLT